jgi:predicted HicB family RNase H-like nuclease
MSSVMEYKGYTGSVEYSAEDNLLYGRLVGIRDRILFDGEDVKTLQKNFRGAVDEYLAFCEAEGKTPDKPFKGSLNIRIPSELHRSLTLVAEQEHKSLNSVIAERLGGSLLLGPATGAALAAFAGNNAGAALTGKAGAARSAMLSALTGKQLGGHLQGPMFEAAKQLSYTASASRGEAGRSNKTTANRSRTRRAG